MVNVRKCRLVYFRYSRIHIVLYPLLVGRQLCMETNLGEFVTRSKAGGGSSQRVAHGRTLVLVLLEIE